MMENKLLAQERRQRILKIIEEHGSVSVRDLGQNFEVSPITIARDLQELEQQGMIQRIHGGAISVRGASYEPPFNARETRDTSEKARIAARAVEFIQDGDSLVLDVGTTALEVARALKGKRNLTVLVTNLRAAEELATQPAIQVIVIGGHLRNSELSMVGHLAENTLRTFHVDKALIGIGGITREQGLTEFNFEEAGTKLAMMQCARQTIVVADHSKFGKVMLTTVAPLTAADIIITGVEADEQIVEQIRQQGIEVVLV